MASVAEQEFSEEYLNQTQQPTLYGISGLFVFLCTAAVLLRFLSRRIGRVSFHYDDIFILAGWVSQTALAACVIADVRYGGVGLHEARVLRTNPKMLIIWAKFVLALPFIYIPAAIFPKLAVLSLYLSIFTTHTPSRVICYVTGALMIANGIGGLGAGFGICKPLNYLWNKDIQGTCLDINAWFRWSRVVNIFSDVVMLALPIPHVMKLQTSTKLKLGLLVTFSLGGLGLISAIVTIAKISQTNAVEDDTWSASTIILWSLIEASVYLITASMMSYRPLLKCAWKKTPWGSNNSEGSDDSHLPRRSGFSREEQGYKVYSRTDDDGIALAAMEEQRHVKNKGSGIWVERQYTVE